MGFSTSLPTDRVPAYRRIAEGLRQEIMSGQRVAGSQLPSTNELAAQLRISPYTVHTALTRLVKEGWVERLNGTGTYVTDPGRRFVCAGIYHAGDMCSDDRPEFIRKLHTALLERFKLRGKRTHIFIDTRPFEEQTTILPILQKALEERSIQCLVAPTMSPQAIPALERLRLPTAFLGSRTTHHYITADKANLLSQSILRLMVQGCRSIGLIANISSGSEGGVDLLNQFENTVRAKGASTRTDWMRLPPTDIIGPAYDAFGYAAFHRIWALPEKPDGLIVYPDVLVRGVTAAVLETGVDVVLPRMQFVMHRNANIPQFCPFPMTWAVSDEYAWAEALIGVIESQFDGRPIESVLVPYTLEPNILPAR